MDFQEIAFGARSDSSYTGDEADTKYTKTDEQKDAGVNFKITEEEIPNVHGEESQENADEEENDAGV